MDRGIDVVVVGDINVDLVFMIDSYPERGGNRIANDFKKFYGGVGGNRAAALASLGLKVSLIGAVGGDVFGVEALRELASFGVDVERVRVLRDSFTGLMIIAVDSGGERTIIGSRGANAKVRIDEADISLVRRAKHLHVSGYQLFNEDGGKGVLELLKYARASGVSTSMDAEGLADLEKDFLGELKGLLTYVMANEAEAEALISAEGKEPVEELLRMFDAEMAAVKMGEKGCVIADRGKKLMVPGFRVKVLDTTGAGDAFNAGLIYGVLNNMDLHGIALLANAMGAYKCMGLGAKHYPTLNTLLESFPKLRDTMTFLPR